MGKITWAREVKRVKQEVEIIVSYDEQWVHGKIPGKGIFLKWDAEIFRLQLHSFYVDPNTAQNLNVDPDPGD
jgi:hypothetical protein